MSTTVNDILKKINPNLIVDSNSVLVIGEPNNHNILMTEKGSVTGPVADIVNKVDEVLSKFKFAFTYELSNRELQFMMLPSYWVEFRNITLTVAEVPIDEIPGMVKYLIVMKDETGEDFNWDPYCTEFFVTEESLTKAMDYVHKDIIAKADDMIETIKWYVNNELHNRGKELHYKLEEVNG